LTRWIKKGGFLIFTQDQFNAVTAAAAKYSQTVTDPKAAMIMTYNSFYGLVWSISLFFLLPQKFIVHISFLQPVATLLIFYDAPNRPSDIFDDFLNIRPLTKDVSTRSYLSFVKLAPSDITLGTRYAPSPMPSQ
jgi:hypothetical protein